MIRWKTTRCWPTSWKLLQTIGKLIPGRNNFRCLAAFLSSSVIGSVQALRIKLLFTKDLQSKNKYFSINTAISIEKHSY